MKRTLFFSTLLLASMIACYKDDAVLSENTISDDPLTKAQSYLAHDAT